MSNLDALDESHVAAGLDAVELGQDLARVGGEGDQDGELGQGHEAHVGLGVGPQLGLGDQVDGVLLGLEAGGQEVAIAHVLAVVHARRKGFINVKVSMKTYLGLYKLSETCHSFTGPVLEPRKGRKK